MSAVLCHELHARAQGCMANSLVVAEALSLIQAAAPPAAGVHSYACHSTTHPSNPGPPQCDFAAASPLSDQGTPRMS